MKKTHILVGILAILAIFGFAYFTYFQQEPVVPVCEAQTWTDHLIGDVMTCHSETYSYNDATAKARICGPDHVPETMHKGDQMLVRCEGSNQRLYIGTTAEDCDSDGCEGTLAAGTTYITDITPDITGIQAVCWSKVTDSVGDWAWTAITYDRTWEISDRWETEICEPITEADGSIYDDCRPIEC